MEWRVDGLYRWIGARAARKAKQADRDCEPKRFHSRHPYDHNHIDAVTAGRRLTVGGYSPLGWALAQPPRQRLVPSSFNITELLPFG